MSYIDTFQLVNNDKTISPVLITIRSYGNWFESTFDKYTSQTELYMKSKKKTGESLLEWHPGTRIGHYFDNNSFSSGKYKSWFILQDSPMIDRLVKLKLAEYKDAIPICKDGQRMLRVYTVDQIQIYIKTLIDRNFDISTYLSAPKQIKVRDCDMDKVIMPEVSTSRKSLF